MKNQGYIYCFSNRAMRGILKIGMTKRDPTIRLSEANQSDTWRPPFPFQVEFSKKVINPKFEEKRMHNILTRRNKRLNPNREFFKVSVQETKSLFDDVDGEYVIFNYNNNNDDNDDNDNEDHIVQNSFVSPVEIWCAEHGYNKSTDIQYCHYLCFLTWLQQNMSGLEKYYTYNRFVKSIT